MNILLTKGTRKWFLKEKSISTNELTQAADEITKGNYEANLGANVYKKRISNGQAKGKSGGSRLIIAYKKGNHIFFMYAFNKNEQGNLRIKEKIVLKERAKIYFSMKEKDIQKAIAAKIFYKIGEL